MDVKPCIVCGADIQRPPKMYPSVWARRRCCSKLCSAKRRHIGLYANLPVTKDCVQCREPMAQGETETPADWAARRFCSRACIGKHKTAHADEGREARTCPICKVEYRRPPSHHKSHSTCGALGCRKAYGKIRGAQQSKAMRKAYADGTRRRGPGVSPRELALWPLLAPLGWVWQLRWTAEQPVELDFALMERKLNVEIDGEEHRWTHRRTLDESRDALLEAQGWRILRIANEDVDADPAAVVERILAFAATPKDAT